MATTNKAFRVKNGLIVEGAELKPAIGTTTYPPVLFTSGTNLTTAVAGSMEYDGTNFYLTPSGTARKTVAYLDSVLTSSVFLGTTAVALNRSSGALSLAGVSIDGNAGTVTNGVVTTGSYANPSFITSLAWSKITTTPTTLSGYGITDAASSIHSHGNISSTGTVGTTANLVLVTGVSGAVTVAPTPVTPSTQFLRGDLTWVTPTDTNYYPSAIVFNAGTTAGPTLDLTMSGAGAPDLTAVAIPSASNSASGIVTTDAQTFAGVKTFASFPVGPNANPSTALEFANKQYVDNMASGVNAHDSVVAATTTALTAAYNNGTSGVGATLTNSGTQAALVIDNVSLLQNDRVLVKNQGTTFQNGIYVVTTVGTGSTNWVLTRAGDYDQHIAGEVAAGDTTFVIAPAAQFTVTPSNQTTGWIMNSPGTIVIGSSAITFVQGSGTGTVTAGTGITVTGNQVAVDSTVIRTTGTQAIASGLTVTSPIVTTSLTTGSASFDLLNTNATTINFADATTTLNLGTGSFTTLRTINIGSSASGTGNAQTINLGVNSTTTATSLINIGGSTSTTTTITGVVKLPTLGTSGFVKLSTGGQLIQDTNTYLTSSTGVTTVNGSSGAISNVALTTGKLSQFAATTSAELLGVISDETGTGALVFAGSPALTGTVTLNAIAGSVTASGSTTGTTPLTLSTVYASGTYNGGEFIIKATNSTNIEITKVLVITDGTNVYMTTYGDVFIATDLITIDFTYTGANVNMVVTPVAGTTGTTSVKVSGTLVAV